MSNVTNVTGLNSSLSYHRAQGDVSTHGLSTDTANNLGYGVGKLVRGAFDSLWNTWQKMWTPAPSAAEIAGQRNYMIYKEGLKECVKLLGPALTKLEMNPRDLSALKKVEQLSAHFARYLKPSAEGNLRELQNEILKSLEERVSAIAHRNMSSALSKWMPVFFQASNQKRQEPTFPTRTPSKAPTLAPTKAPTRTPTSAPISNPTSRPTNHPTHTPPDFPTAAPTVAINDTGLIVFLSCGVSALLVVLGVVIYRFKKEEKEEEKPSESGRLLINTKT